MADRVLKLRVIWPNPIPGDRDGRATRFGMQRGRSELLPGTQRDDGATIFETEVTPYVDKTGRQRFRGECMQGPPNEPFLYLSYCFADDGVWIGRGKALLESVTDEFLATVPEGAVLEMRMERLAGRTGASKWQVAAD